MLPTSLAGAGALALSNASILLLVVKATLILIGAIGITLAMQRASAGARHLVWLVTLATLLLVPALTAWSPLRLKVLPATAAAGAAAQPAANAPAPTSSPSSSQANLQRDVAVGPSTPSIAAPELSAPTLQSRLSGMSPLAVVAAIWALVALAIAATLAWAGLAVRRIVRHARPLEDQSWLVPLWEVSDRLGLDQAPRLLRSDEAKMPFACGMLTPTIVLPAECDAWTHERRQAVLLHELAHVRRRDLVGHTLARLACAVYWFHPLVWTAAKQLRAESERACDDLALACGTRATDYAEHLLDIVTSVRRDHTPLVALAMARRKEFEGRMLAILDPELRHSSPSRRQSATLIGSLALMAVTIGATSPAPRERAAVTQVSAQRSATAKTMPAPRRELSPKANAHVLDASARPAPLPMASPLPSNAPNLNTIVNRVTNSSTNTIVSSPGGAIGQIFGDKTGLTAQGTSDERAALLAKVLKTDANADLRRVAAWGLSEYADTPVASEALASALGHDADAKVREMSAWALASGDDASSAATTALGTALRRDADETVRATSAWALGSMGDRSSTDAVVAALGDANARVRSRAAWALGNMEPKQAPKALVAMLGDKDARVRELAAWALYQIEDPGAIPALESALKGENDKEVQLAYIRAMAACGERSVEALKGLLESPDPKIKSMAVHALAGGHASGPWPWPWPQPRPFP